MALPEELLAHKKLLDDLDKKDWARLAGTHLADVHKLTDEVTELRKTVSLYRLVVVNAEAVGLGAAAMSTLEGVRVELLQCVNAIEQFVGSSPSTTDQRIGSMRSTIINAYRNVGAQLAPYVAQAKIQEFRDQVAQIRDLDRLRQEAAQDAATYRSLQENVRQLQEALQNKLTQATVLDESDRFETAAKDFKTEARSWAIGVGTMGVVLLGIIGHSMLCAPGPPLRTASWTTAANLSHFGARALFVTILSFLMVLLVKNFRAAKHNEIMNDHRARALRTFDDFKQGSEGKEVHDAILLHASDAIFSMQPSGYAPGEPIGSTPAGEIVRLVKNETGE